MYWPSPEESEVAHCGGSDKVPQSCNTDRRSVCPPLGPSMDMASDRELVEVDVSQLATSIYFGPESKGQRASLSSDGDMNSASTSRGCHSSTNDVVERFGVNFQQYSPSASK